MGQNALIGGLVKLPLACEISEFVLEQGEEILVVDGLRIVLELVVVGEGVFGESVVALVHVGRVQIDLAVVDHILHRVTTVEIHVERLVGTFLGGQRLIVLDLYSVAALYETQVQVAVLEVEELTVAVGAAHEEIIERLVVLHQVGVDELRWNLGADVALPLYFDRGLLVVSQEAQSLGVGADQRLLVALVEHTEVLRLYLQDARTQLAGHVGLAVLVERHPLVHTEDVQLHVHLPRSVCVGRHMRIQFVDVVGTGDGGLARLLSRSGRNHLDRHRHHALSEQGADVVEFRQRRGAVAVSLHEVELCLYLVGLIDPLVDLHAVQCELEGRFLDFILQCQFFRLYDVYGGNALLRGRNPRPEDYPVPVTVVRTLQCILFCHSSKEDYLFMLLIH